jgi:hypothetical protein
VKTTRYAPVLFLMVASVIALASSGNPIVLKAWQKDGEPYGGMRAFYDHYKTVLAYKTLEEISGMPVFKKGPHKNGKLDLNNSTDFGYYNKDFVNWAHRNLILGQDNEDLRKQLQPIYDKKIKNLARLYYRAYMKLSSDIQYRAKLLARYKKAIRKSRKSGQPNWYHESFANMVETKEADPNLGSRTIAFWLRRKLDRTDSAFARALTTLLKTYDPEYLQGQRAKKAGKSWPLPLNSRIVQNSAKAQLVEVYLGLKKPMAPPEKITVIFSDSFVVGDFVEKRIKAEEACGGEILLKPEFAIYKMRSPKKGTVVTALTGDVAIKGLRALQLQGTDLPKSVFATDGQKVRFHTGREAEVRYTWQRTKDGQMQLQLKGRHEHSKKWHSSGSFVVNQMEVRRAGPFWHVIPKQQHRGLVELLLTDKDVLLLSSSDPNWLTAKALPKFTLKLNGQDAYLVEVGFHSELAHALMVKTGAGWVIKVFKPDMPGSC